jgi:hypothetical protein
MEVAACDRNGRLLANIRSCPLTWKNSGYADTQTYGEAALAPRKPYDAELADLERHYTKVRDWDDGGALRQALLMVAGGPAVFVGTGGTLAVARLAAQLHERVGGQPGRALTPLELAAMPPMARSGVVLFSVGLKHPDALAALRRMGNSRLRPAVVLTLRDPTTLSDVVPPDVVVVGLPGPSFAEGFLATTSVLVMMTAIVRAYTSDDVLPSEFPSPSVEIPKVAENLLVLTTPGLVPVATDIETRCHELGLAAVQVTDYRNLAHGRHVGLARRAPNTTVLGLVAEPLERLALATLETLPTSEISVTTWHAQHRSPIAVLELTIASMHLAGALAASQGVNAARPGAAPFGRRLYHLGLQKLLPPVEDGPVERKLVALAAGLSTGATRDLYVDALSSWIKQLGAERFGGLVLDYDGTVCATTRRTDLPTPAMRSAILRLLDADVLVGFATGRGKSLHQDLRQWVPKRHWPRVITGLYNGGANVSLEDDLPDFSEPSSLMRRAEGRLGELPFADALTVEARTAQITVTIRPNAYAQIGRLSDLIADAMSRSPAISVKVMTSGHSVDVVPRSTTKQAVVGRVSRATDLAVLAIGDQGDVGGNDFELLAGDAWTLTVDRCSADPTRCWYLDRRGRTGPELLIAYLDAMTVDEGQFALAWNDA